MVHTDSINRNVFGRRVRSYRLDEAIRGEQWKYIDYIDLDGMDELYDLKADPYKMKNLAAGSQARETEAQMRTKLQQLVDLPK